MRQSFYIAVAMLLFCLVWFLLVSGIYHLAFAWLAPPAVHRSAERPVWEIMFAFGASSVAALIASRIERPSVRWLRRALLYSLVCSAVLFLGYLITGAVPWLLGPPR